MMKKCVRLSLIFLVLAVLLAVCSACSVTDPKEDTAHIHSYASEWTFDENQHYHTCECGAKAGTAEHTYPEGIQIVTPATCTQTGSGTVTCSVCGKTKTVSIPCVDHTYGEWSVLVPATETEEGTETRECSVCHTEETRSIPSESALISLSSESYYGYQFLLSLGKSGKAALYAYAQIAAGAELCLEEIALDDGGVDITEDDLILAFNCYRADYPQHFWVDDGYRYGHIDSVVTKILLNYSVTDSSSLAAMKKQFNDAVASLLSGITRTMSEAEREFAIHDKIVTNAQYDTTLAAEHIHDAYGAIVGKSAVCDGYVKAFQYLLYSAGIQSTPIYGTVRIGTNNVSHSWNAVLLDNEYYFVDITWDDPTANGPTDVSHQYLNLSSALLAYDHTPSSSFEESVRVRYDIPSATATKYHYYTYYGYAKENLTVDTIADAMQTAIANGVSGKYPLYLTSSMTYSAVSAYINTNVNALYDRVMTLLRADKVSIFYSLSDSGSLFVLTAEPQKSEFSDHVFGDEVIARAATCSETGLSQKTCKYCGYVDNTELPLKNHTYGAWTVLTPATVTTAGEKERICSICTYHDTRVIPILIELSPLTREDYYGYQYLSAKENGANLLHFYNLIADTVENEELPESIVLNDNIEYSISVSDLATVYKCYRADYPQHFWLEDVYGYTYKDGTAVSVSPKYTVETKAELTAMKSAVKAKVALLLDGIDGNMTDIEREMEIHDRLVLHNTYDKTLSKAHIHDLYGSLVSQTSVCDGYAEAFQYLMYECGIPCTLLTGEANSGSKTENHAWNAVKLDGKWYLVDVTWDDPVGSESDHVDFTYLNITSAQMALNHTVDPEQTVYAAPSCTSTDAQYYYYNGYTADAFTVADFRTVLAKEIADEMTEEFAMYITSGGMTLQSVSDAFDDKTFNSGFFNACKELLHLTSVNLLYSVDAGGHVLTFTITEKASD